MIRLQFQGAFYRPLEPSQNRYFAGPPVFSGGPGPLGPHHWTGETEPGLVASYDIRPWNGAGLFLQPPRSPHGGRNGLSDTWRRCVYEMWARRSQCLFWPSDGSTQQLSLRPVSHHLPPTTVAAAAAAYQWWVDLAESRPVRQSPIPLTQPRARILVKVGHENFRFTKWMVATHN